MNWPFEFTCIDHCSFHEPLSACICDDNLDGLDRLFQSENMLAIIRAAVHPTISHLWRQNHLLRLFSISSATSKSNWSKDSKTRRRQYDDNLARQRKEYAQNAEVREKALSRLRATRAARSEADARRIRQRNSCYKWVVNGLRHGIVRSWKTHTPELFDKSNVRLCSGCNVLLRKTLWWKRNDDYDFDSGDQYDVCVLLPIQERFFLMVLIYLGIC